MSRSSTSPARQTIRTPLKARRAVRREIHEAPQRGRLEINFNHDWLFFRSESGAEAATPAELNGQPWETVDLPHSARLEPLNASGGRNFQGVSWYRKRLEIPGEWRGRVVYLHFEGAMQQASVWLNGRLVAEHFCGYTPFTIDLTHLLADDNWITVRLDNGDNPHIPPGKPQRELDFVYFGGLYRNVRLTVADPLHITDPILEHLAGGGGPSGGGVFVSFPRVTAQSAAARVSTEIRNEYLTAKTVVVRQQLFDAEGKNVASHSAQAIVAPEEYAAVSGQLRVPRPRLWHPDHPYLYELRTSVVEDGIEIDRQSTRIGIRHLRFDAAGGLFINHERFLAIGANRHQDHPYVGYALPDNIHRRDVKKLREAGFTAVRSHYPQAAAFMDACDELGMLAIVSNPGWQFVGDERFVRQAVANARCMVRRDRNRPSVLLWEAALNESDNGLIAAELHKAVHDECPGGMCHTAGDHQPPARWDVEYLHNDGSRPYFIREFGDHVDNWRDQQSRTRVRRGWGEAAMVVQAQAHIARLNEVKACGQRVAGACLWAGIDCYRGYHHDPFYGGVLDLFRQPKFTYYFFQSQRPPRARVAPVDGGAMVFIAAHNTFFSSRRAMVFSNCEEVRLKLDGVEIDRRRPDGGYDLAHPPFTFNLPAAAREQSTMYMNGGAALEPAPRELLAEGIIGGKVAARHKLCAPGVAAAISVEADLCGIDLQADRSDWVRVFAYIRDARGSVCPLSDDWITFAAEGEGSLIGTEAIAANPVRAEAGIAAALVRSSGRSGKIIISASAFGLADGRVQITAGPRPRGRGF